jgi:hypothetical protein
MAQHGGQPGWLEEIDPAGCDFVRDGRSMLPSLTDCTACPYLKLLSAVSFWQIKAAVVDVLVLNVHRTPSWAFLRKEGM